MTKDTKKKTHQQNETQATEAVADVSLAELEAKLETAEAKYQRALADYQNLVRRNREESVQKAKLATKEFVSNLIQPLNHLELAAEQLNDSGLNMVVSQLWETLNREGLEKVECMGKPFDAESMEVVEITDKGEKVIKVLTPCYALNGTVIQFAKVILD